MSRAAGVFFSDLSRMFIEYTILQVCKITDPAQDCRGNDNHTITFLLTKYDFGVYPALKAQLDVLEARLQDFRKKLLPARNKLISHADRDAILAGVPLGGATEYEWSGFWRDLQELVCIIHEKVLSKRFYLNDAAMLSDADGLLKVLKHAACFEELAKDPALAQRCADLALRGSGEWNPEPELPGTQNP